MTPRHPVAAFAMLALLLLRVGTSPVMTDCTAAHHDGAEAVTSTPTQHSGHDVAPTNPAAPAGCDHPSGDGGTHNAADCAQMTGCSTGVVMIAASSTEIEASSQYGSTALVAPQIAPRSTRPTSPPPKA